MEFLKAVELIKKPKNADLLAKAIEKQNRISFWTREALSENELSEYKNKFFTEVNAIYTDNEAFANFKRHLTYPLQTQGFTNEIKDDLHKIFDGVNSYINFTDKKNQSLNKYFDRDYFSDELYNYWWEKPNNIVVTDKYDKETKRYFLDIECVVDCDEDKEGMIYCIWEGEKENDTTLYYVYDRFEMLVVRKKGEEYYQEGEIEKVKFGICPAQFISNKGYVVKKFILDPVLGTIEELLRAKVNKSIQESYFAPFIKKYGTSGCDWSNGDTYCVGGFIAIQNETNSIELVQEGKGYKHCPACNSKVSYGATINSPAPADREQVDLIEKAISFVFPETDFLKYTNETIKSKEQELKSDIFGEYSTLNPNQQQNEKRVESNLEGKTNTLNIWKSIFENAIDILTNIFIGFETANTANTTTVNLGTEYYIKTLHDIIEEKNKADETGIDYIDYEQQIINTKYKNNPDERARLTLIKQLAEIIRPYNSLTKTEVLELQEITPADRRLNLEFFDLIKRFELERDTTLNEFFNEGVKTKGKAIVIKEALLGYINENNKKDE